MDVFLVESDACISDSDFSVIADGGVDSGCDVDIYISAGRCIFDGVGEEIDEHLVEIVAVNPHIQLCQIRRGGRETEFLPLFLRLGLEYFNEVACETYQLRFRTFDFHFTLVNLSNVEELIDKGEDAVGIPVDCVEIFGCLGIMVFFHDAFERTENQCER